MINFSEISTTPGRNKDVEDRSGSKHIGLPFKCFEKRVACTWRRGNQFSVYPRSQKISKNNNEKIDDTIMNVRQEVMLFTPILRKLVNESNGTYLALQKIVESSKNTDNHVEYLKISRQYRSIVRVCIENLQEAAEKAQSDEEKNNLLSYITIFYSVECVWHLCEILFIDNLPGDVVLPYLLEWVRFHFPCHEQTAAQMLEACERGSESHPEYWDTVTGMIVQGRVDVARALLKLHSASESNEFKLVDNSLRSMPVYSVYGGISTGEFTISWKHWQAECRSKLSSRSLASQPNLELILRLTTGDYAAFESIRDKYDSWFDLIGGWLMFTAPWTKSYELSNVASACAGMRHNNMKTTVLDHIVRALTDGELHQVIHEIQQMADNGWFATHLTDLLFQCGKLKILDTQQINVTAKLRSSLILEYGSMLMDHKSLWPVGLSYLVSCPPEGQRRAELMLERIPVKTEAKAMRVIAEAKKYNLMGVAQTVSSCVCARHISSGRAGGALSWAVRARSSLLSARAADLALRAYCTTSTGPRTIPAADLLLTIGPNMLLSDRLVFLGKYCEFHRLYKNREFKLAGKLLISLLKSKIAPDYFWQSLLLDALPLLECDRPVLSAEDTTELMAILALREDCLAKDQADLIRLGLVRNLAKASLAPPDEE